MIAARAVGSVIFAESIAPIIACLPLEEPTFAGFVSAEEGAFAPGDGAAADGAAAGAGFVIGVGALTGGAGGAIPAGDGTTIDSGGGAVSTG